MSLVGNEQVIARRDDMPPPAGRRSLRIYVGLAETLRALQALTLRA